MNIGWIKIERTSKKKRFGGSIYNERSREALQSFGKVDEIGVDRGNIDRLHPLLRIPLLIYKLSKVSGVRDLWVRDFYSTLTIGFDNTRGKNLVLIHHIDYTSLPKALAIFFKIYETLFYLQLRKADGIVVMSDYWRKHFLRKGFKNVYTVYNPIDFEGYKFSDSDIQKFKKKYHLGSKPIVYLGNCRAYKGVQEAYEVLKDLDVQLITSGHREVKLPIKNLNLTHKEQLILMKAAYLTIAMSKFKEGWSMTVQESLYCKTPVIGSGKGGMIELLEGGKQIVCTDFNNLRKKVMTLLSDRELRNNMGADGYQFVKQFTRERFKNDWSFAIQELNKKKSDIL